ncbi:hypothetical protein ABH973_000828 [Bradyrhizobium ottawaense]|nr:hypothetical protein [Bradyrhizobium sp. WBAH30]MDD1546352.1 hypothetical protein [Bradyrhizobium sp. WBAH41]MDD1560516.1 hypothetical protein [Bradyrhizobium sp. WBAH23]MDD1567359.1 hypothetical protein [Bradyrhizobium sp. WBAH33]MDD1594169.1 hypothetical protein [Bradyrhizobium sp. WBAH42]NRB90843.1 hypothetical protein [Bradyrhizobium sp. WBAH10]QCJ93531.1 hypothetical protein DAA57_37715 [Bradyrhizobium yuanmingense]
MARARRATLVVDAVIERDSTMRTIWGAVEGNNAAHETVLVVSHSDGTNIVEESGHIGLVELARRSTVGTHSNLRVNSWAPSNPGGH